MTRLSTRTVADSFDFQQQVTQLASLPQVHAAFSWFSVHENELQRMQLEVARIPAPPFGEADRATWLREHFRAIGLEQVEIDEIGNVIGCLPGTLPGNGTRPGVAITAHLDTVFPTGTEISIQDERHRLVGPGVSDNAAGLTAMLAVAMAMRHVQIPRASNLIFIGNVGEEGEGDLRGMRYIFQKSPWREQIGYTVVIDGTGADSIIGQALGSRRFEIILRGPGGHSWSDFGQPNPIVTLSRMIASFSRILLPVAPKTTFNFGVISGGTSVNSIPQMAQVSVDLRSASSAELQRLEDELRQAITAELSDSGHNGSAAPLSCELRQIGDRPAGELAPNARIVEVIRAVDAHLGIASQMRRASTDANIPISMGRQAISIGAGGSGGGAHTLREWFYPAGRGLALKRILLAVLALAGIEQ